MLLVFLLLFSSVFIETKCSTPTELFNSLIVGFSSSSPISSNDDQLGSTSSSVLPQNPPVVELPLAKARMLQQWVGQVAQQIVVEDGTFAGHYSCVAKNGMGKAFLSVGLPKKQLKANAFLLGDEFKKLGEQKFHFLKMLFAFGALLSAEIGQQSFRERSFTRIFLKAYECVEDKKFVGNEKDFLPFAIVSKMKGQTEQLNIEKILLVIQNDEDLTDRRLQIDKDLALLSALNIEMNARDAIEFASFVHYALLNEYSRNPFEKFFLAKNGLTTENLGQDPVKYRRIAYQLLIWLRNWDQNDLKKISEERKYKIKLTTREKCVFGIFTRNLMRRMANFELLNEYFGELNSSGLPGIVQIEQEFFEKLSKQNCKISKNGRTEENDENGEERMEEGRRKEEDEENGEERMDEGETANAKGEHENEEAGRNYLHFDEALQIEWNVWKEIIQKIDEISEKIKTKHRKYKLGKYLKSGEYEEGMRMIKAQFDEKQFDGLALKVEKRKEFGTELEVTPKEKIVEFCGKLAKIKQISEQNIEKYEREVPFKRNIVIKQKENYAKFYEFLILVAKYFGGKVIKSEYAGENLQIELNGANELLDKVYEMAKTIKNKELNFKKSIQKILEKKLDENLETLLNQFEEPTEFIKIPYKSAENRKEIEQKYLHKQFVEAQLFNLLFSFAVRLEAIVHGKKEDGTIEEENGKKEDGTIEEEEENAEKEGDKIQMFLAVLGKFNLPEWANNFSIFDCWMKIKNLKQKEGGISLGIEIESNLNKEKDKALAVSRARENFKMLKRINEQKFSVYETTKMLRKIYDAIDSFRYSSSELAMPEIFKNLVDQIRWENQIKWYQNYYVYSYYGGLIGGCEFVTLFQNISKKFMKMMAKKGIDPQKHFDWLDKRNQEDVAERDIPRFCEELKKVDRKAEETKIELLNNVRYDLVVHFEFNRRKDIYDRTDDLLLEWVKRNTNDEENSETMAKNIYYFTTETNKEKIAKIESLKEEEKEDGLEIGKKFNELDELQGKIVDEANLELQKAKKELKKLEKEKIEKGYEKERIIQKLRKKNKKLKKESEKVKKLKKESEKLAEIKKNDSKFMNEFLDWMKDGKMTEKAEQIIKIWQIKKKMEKVEMDIKELEKKEDELKEEKEKRKMPKNDKKETEKEEEEEERKVMEKNKEKLIKKQNLQKNWEKVYWKSESLWEKLDEIEENSEEDLMEKILKEKDENEISKLIVEQYEKETKKVNKELVVDLDDILTEFKIQKSKKKRKEIQGIEEEIKKLEEEKSKVENDLTETQKQIDENQFKKQTEKLRKLAKSFGEMLEELKKHYEEKKKEA